jgi:hypothetical protein
MLNLVKIAGQMGGMSEQMLRDSKHTSAKLLQAQALFAKTVAATARQIAAIDCSFIPKSGKATYRIEYFYNGTAGKAEKGLEISL